MAKDFISRFLYCLFGATSFASASEVFTSLEHLATRVGFLSHGFSATLRLLASFCSCGELKFAITLPVMVEHVLARLSFLSQTMLFPSSCAAAFLFGQAFSLSSGILVDFLRAWCGETATSFAGFKWALACDFGRVYFLMWWAGLELVKFVYAGLQF